MRRDRSVPFACAMRAHNGMHLYLRRYALTTINTSTYESTNYQNIRRPHRRCILTKSSTNLDRAYSCSDVEMVANVHVVVWRCHSYSNNDVRGIVASTPLVKELHITMRRMLSFRAPKHLHSS